MSFFTKSQLVHGKPIDIELFRSGTVITTRTGMIEQDSGGTCFAVIDDFVAGRYTARISVDGKCFREISFWVKHTPG